MVDPARGIAAKQRVDHVFLVDVKIERVIRVARVMRVAALGLFPGDDLANVLDDRLAFGDVFDGKHAVAMNA